MGFSFVGFFFICMSPASGLDLKWWLVCWSTKLSWLLDFIWCSNFWVKWPLPHSRSNSLTNFVLSWQTGKHLCSSWLSWYCNWHSQACILRNSNFSATLEKSNSGSWSVIAWGWIFVIITGLFYANKIHYTRTDNFFPAILTWKWKSMLYNSSNLGTIRMLFYQSKNPYPLGPHSVQSVGAAEAVSRAIGHNPGQVDTPT